MKWLIDAFTRRTKAAQKGWQDALDRLEIANKNNCELLDMVKQLRGERSDLLAENDKYAKANATYKRTNEELNRRLASWTEKVGKLEAALDAEIISHRACKEAVADRERKIDELKKAVETLTSREFHTVQVISNDRSVLGDAGMRIEQVREALRRLAADLSQRERELSQMSDAITSEEPIDAEEF